MDSVKLTNDKLSVESVYNIVCSPEYGAVSFFIGTTRNSFEGKSVTKLSYEAYEKMAVKSLEKICKDIRKKFDVGNIAIFHRLGDVPIQEASVIIAISSAHRRPALDAVPYAINALKADVPIWKKEIYQDGKTSEWKENSECGWSGMRGLEMNPFRKVEQNEESPKIYRGNKLFDTEDAISSDNTGLIQLYEEVVEAESAYEVPSHLIQIHAGQQEINRRISSFINRKREQINVSNVQDFCLERHENTDESTCARVSAALIRRKGSISHLKVHRVQNFVGPQTDGFDLATYLPPPENSVLIPNCPSGAEERLANAELYLNVNQTSKDVFTRLKAIEDKILFLESISPEYFDFERVEIPKRKHGNIPSKRMHSTSDLDLKMQKLEAKLKKKIEKLSLI